MIISDICRISYAFGKQFSQHPLNIACSDLGLLLHSDHLEKPASALYNPILMAALLNMSSLWGKKKTVNMFQIWLMRFGQTYGIHNFGN